MKLIFAKFAGKCATCGGPIGKGDKIWFNPDAPKGKTATHFDCAGKAKTPEAKTPSQPQPVPEAPAGPAQISPEGFFAPTFTRLFNGADELAAQANPSEANKHKHAKLMRGEPQNGGLGAKAWYGFDTLGEALEAFRHGWPEGAKRLTDTLESVNIELNLLSRRRKSVWSDQGDEVDMQRVWAGRLDRSFRRTRRLDRRSPGVVTIVVNHSINWKINSDRLFWAGAAALRLALDLEESGASVEIVVAAGTSGATVDEDSFGMIATAKEAGAPLDLEAMAGICCTGVVMRHFMLTHMTELDAQLDSGYGTPIRQLPEALATRERIVVAQAQRIAGAKEAAAWAAAAADYIRTGMDQNDAQAA